MCNRKVLHGGDVIRAQDIVQVIQEKNSKIHIFEIHEEKIIEKNKSLPDSLKTFDGTRTVH